MKPLLFLAVHLLVASVLGQQLPSRCGFGEIEQMVLSDPKLQFEKDHLEGMLTRWQSAPETARSAGVLTIPVVFHVVWNLPEENISFDQIAAQLDILNRDFGGKNEDRTDLPEPFAAIQSESQIRFCFTNQTPDGLISNGVTRTQTAVEEIGRKYNVHFDELGGKSIWDADRYLNVWVCNYDDTRQTLGSARPPYIITRDGKDKDGVVIDYRAFGIGGTALHPTDGGRTLVHEIAHYLNVEHLWKHNVCADDGVMDTPIQGRSYSGCPDFPKSSCGSVDMPMNFMDYVNDDCMRFFTEGQMQRMIGVLSTVRRPLVANPFAVCNLTTRSGEIKLDNISIFPNPVSDRFQIKRHEWDAGGEIHWRMFSGHGKLIRAWTMAAEDRHQMIEVMQITPGVYHLHGQSQEGVLWKRLVVLD